MILIVTNRRDVTTDFVVSKLRAMNATFIRLNTETLLSEWTFSWSTSGWRARDRRGRIIDSAAVNAVYYRRPLPPAPIDGTTRDAGAFLIRETQTVFRSLLEQLDCYWMSSISAIERAEDKLFQLRVASSLGFVVPESLVTNDSANAREFLNQNGSVILKPLSSGLISGDPGKILFTELVANADLVDVELGPHYFQKRVEKVSDLRVTVVANDVFCCRIDSQIHEATSLDWRRANISDIRLDHDLVELEVDTAYKCKQLLYTLGLKFGAIDLVETRDGVVFLEINPNGQWAWIEQRTGAQISTAIAEALIHAGH